MTFLHSRNLFFSNLKFNKQKTYVNLSLNFRRVIKFSLLLKKKKIKVGVYDVNLRYHKNVLNVS